MGKTYTAGETLTAADLNASLSESVNTSGYFVFAGIPAATAQYGYPFYSGEHVHNAKLTANSGFEANTSPSNFYSVTNFTKNILVKEGGNITLDTGSITATQGNITAPAGTVSDRIGNLRQVPVSGASPGYTLVALDSGKVLNIGGGTVTIPANIFQAGDTVTLLNTSTTGALTITQGTGLTMYWAGQTAVTIGNRSLGIFSMSTILFINTTTAIIAGAGLN